ncbi:hypothetical protein I3842_02G117600 [Carya illinoinensis]|uniref:Uncharacterized protein n=1 Tax=Carya illinoinensis TaxID=32201 RepID=A0A922FQL4_CARIL|nr:hypothetical protein I3842_02G117600 [Carya illinoinensis]
MGQFHLLLAAPVTLIRPSQTLSYMFLFFYFFFSLHDQSLEKGACICNLLVHDLKSYQISPSDLAIEHCLMPQYCFC